MTDLNLRVFEALNTYLVGGPGCPGAGSLGECPAADEQENCYWACVARWPETPPDWRKLRDIVRDAGGVDITISHVLLDEANGDEDGRGFGGATLEITFNGVGDDRLPRRAEATRVPL